MIFLDSDSPLEKGHRGCEDQELNLVSLFTCWQKLVLRAGGGCLKKYLGIKIDC